MQTMLIMTAGLVLLGHVLPSLRHLGAFLRPPPKPAPITCASGNPPLSCRLWPRSGYGSAQYSFSVDALMLWWIWQSGRDGLWSPAEVGLTRMPWPLSVCIGAAVYATVRLLGGVWMRHGTSRKEGANREKQEEPYLLLHNLMRSLMPRNRADRAMALVSACLLGPVTEEFYYRGVLVCQLGLVLGIAPAILIGVALNQLTHLYQGVRAQLYHAISIGICVALLYSPVGLAGAVGYHVIGNLVPVLTYRRTLRAWRRWRHEERERRHGLR